MLTARRAEGRPVGIPDELKARRQWVCWRYEQRGGKATMESRGRWT